MDKHDAILERARPNLEDLGWEEELAVTYLPTEGNGGNIEPAAWRVAVDTGSVYLALPLEFARHEDATRALTALQANGLTTCKRLRAAGKAQLRRIMTEALAW